MGCSKKVILKFVKKPEDNKLALKCDWNSKVCQNVQKIGVFQKKTDFFWKFYIQQLQKTLRYQFCRRM